MLIYYWYDTCVFRLIVKNQTYAAFAVLDIYTLNVSYHAIQLLAIFQIIFILMLSLWYDSTCYLNT